MEIELELFSDESVRTKWSPTACEQLPYCSREFRNSLAQVGVLLGFLLWCKVEAGSKMMTLASTRQMFWMFGYVMLCVYIKNKTRAALDQRNTVPNYDFHMVSVRFSEILLILSIPRFLFSQVASQAPSHWQPRIVEVRPSSSCHADWLPTVPWHHDRSELILETACCGLLQPYQESLGNWLESKTGWVWHGKWFIYNHV